MNGQETVEIAIYKEGDSNTVAVAKAVREKLEEIKKDLPPDSEVRIIEDQSIFIDDAIGNVVSAALLGGILAVSGNLSVFTRVSGNCNHIFIDSCVSYFRFLFHASGWCFTQYHVVGWNCISCWVACR